MHTIPWCIGIGKKTAMIFPIKLVEKQYHDINLLHLQNVIRKCAGAPIRTVNFFSSYSIVFIFKDFVLQNMHDTVNQFDIFWKVDSELNHFEHKQIIQIRWIAHKLCILCYTIIFNDLRSKNNQKWLTYRNWKIYSYLFKYFVPASHQDFHHAYFDEFRWT